MSPAIDIAKFGHSEDLLTEYSPRVSARWFLLKAILTNPLTFLRRLTPRRLLKGIRTLVSNEHVDNNVEQALIQYSSADVRLAESLDVFDPSQPDLWLDKAIEFTIFDKPIVSIVIPVFNNYLMTMSCLRSIAQNTGLDYSFEVILADDYSTDQTRDIEDVVKGLRVVKAKRNVGFLENCNNAVPKAKGDYIVLLNNDTNVQEGWLLELLTPHFLDLDIAITGPMFVYPDGLLQEAGGIVFSDASGWNYGRFDSADKPEYNFARDVDYISGACLAFKKELWVEVGGFDTAFLPAYYEDTDLCFQVRQLGKRVRYIPSSRVVHFERVF